MSDLASMTAVEFFDYLESQPRPDFPPCPSWCTTAGNGDHDPSPILDHLTDPVRWTRVHGIPDSRVPDSEAEGHSLGALGINQMETVAADGTVTYGEVELTVAIADQYGLSPAYARVIAAEILNAALRLEQILAQR